MGSLGSGRRESWGRLLPLPTERAAGVNTADSASVPAARGRRRSGCRGPAASRPSQVTLIRYAPQNPLFPFCLPCPLDP